MRSHRGPVGQLTSRLASPYLPQWYRGSMSGTYSFKVGDRGRAVLPAELRQRRRWPEGTTLIAVETERGVVLATREELEGLVREQLSGTDLVAELLAERRSAASREDEA